MLVEALPYIQRFRGAVVVVKYGGNAMVDPALARGVADDVVLLRAVEVRRRERLHGIVMLDRRAVFYIHLDRGAGECPIGVAARLGGERKTRSLFRLVSLAALLLQVRDVRLARIRNPD